MRWWRRTKYHCSRVSWKMSSRACYHLMGTARAGTISLMKRVSFARSCKFAQDSLSLPLLTNWRRLLNAQLRRRLLWNLPRNLLRNRVQGPLHQTLRYKTKLEWRNGHNSYLQSDRDPLPHGLEPLPFGVDSCSGSGSRQRVDYTRVIR